MIVLFTLTIGTYGQDCSMKCNCVHGICDLATGQCSCDSGYSGPKCDVPCKVESYDLRILIPRLSAYTLSYSSINVDRIFLTFKSLMFNCYSLVVLEITR